MGQTQDLSLSACNAQTGTQAGQRQEKTGEIISGLSESKFVIAHPDDSIKDGVRVKVR
ncbi:MAG: hypothetical protein HY265_07980 [Deltaproteobacteria bacterium]|nr:hypothetical protein [Deltaproteobacteria bacterium]MBI3756080.1 hypothetical protein [Deltaproteobacteria bacterium]